MRQTNGVDGLVIRESGSETIRLSHSPAGVTLAVRVIPRAGRTAIAGVRGGALTVRLAAAPVDGAANDALIAVRTTRDEAVAHLREALRLKPGYEQASKQLRELGVTVTQ